MTRLELDIAAMQIGNAIERRVLDNVRRMCADGAAPEWITAYVGLECEQLQHWLDHELPDQVREALQELDSH